MVEMGLFEPVLMHDPHFGSQMCPGTILANPDNCQETLTIVRTYRKSCPHLVELTIDCQDKIAGEKVQN